LRERVSASTAHIYEAEGTHVCMFDGQTTATPDQDTGATPVKNVAVLSNGHTREG